MGLGAGRGGDRCADSGAQAGQKADGGGGGDPEEGKRTDSGRGKAVDDIRSPLP